MKNIEMYDMLPPEQAAARAWGDPGRSPHIHREAQDNLRRSMPLLARALDRLVDTGRGSSSETGR